MKFLAIFLAIIFFITSLALLIVPIIFCYKKFNKGGKGSYIRGFRNFIILYLFVCFFNVGAEMINLDFVYMFWNSNCFIKYYCDKKKCKNKS